MTFPQFLCTKYPPILEAEAIALIEAAEMIQYLRTQPQQARGFQVWGILHSRPAFRKFQAEKDDAAYGEARALESVGTLMFKLADEIAAHQKAYKALKDGPPKPPDFRSLIHEENTR